MHKVVDLDSYKTKQLDKMNMKKSSETGLPRIYITKEEDKYNIIVSNEGENTLFNKKPIPKLAIAIYAASFCKDRLSEYVGETLPTDIIIFDKDCSEELNME
jgi:hypothetical protein